MATTHATLRQQRCVRATVGQYGAGALPASTALISYTVAFPYRLRVTFNATLYARAATHTYTTRTRDETNAYAQRTRLATLCRTQRTTGRARCTRASRTAQAAARRLSARRRYTPTHTHLLYIAHRRMYARDTTMRHIFAAHTHRHCAAPHIATCPGHAIRTLFVAVACTHLGAALRALSPR